MEYENNQLQHPLEFDDLADFIQYLPTVSEDRKSFVFDTIRTLKEARVDSINYFSEEAIKEQAHGSRIKQIDTFLARYNINNSPQFGPLSAAVAVLTHNQGVVDISGNPANEWDSLDRLFLFYKALEYERAKIVSEVEKNEAWCVIYDLKHPKKDKYENTTGYESKYQSVDVANKELARINSAINNLENRAKLIRVSPTSGVN